MNVEVVIHFLFDEITHILGDTHSIRRHRGRTEFDFRLTLEDRFFYIDRDSSHHTCTNVTRLVFSEELLDGSCDMFFEGTLVCTTLYGMLTIDKRIVFLTILVCMGEGNLDILALQVDDRVECIVRHTVFQQVFQSVS